MIGNNSKQTSDDQFEIEEVDFDNLRKFGIFNHIDTESNFIVACKPIPGVKILLKTVRDDGLLFQITIPSIPEAFFEACLSFSDFGQADIAKSSETYNILYPSPDGVILESRYLLIKDNDLFPHLIGFKCTKLKPAQEVYSVEL